MSAVVPHGIFTKLSALKAPWSGLCHVTQTEKRWESVMGNVQVSPPFRWRAKPCGASSLRLDGKARASPEPQTLGVASDACLHLEFGQKPVEMISY